MQGTPAWFQSLWDAPGWELQTQQKRSQDPTFWFIRVFRREVTGQKGAWLRGPGVWEGLPPLGAIAFPGHCAPRAVGLTRAACTLLRVDGEGSVSPGLPRSQLKPASLDGACL